MLVAILSGCDVIFRLDHIPPPDGPPPIVGRWSRVAGGFGHTCALDLRNRLYCWGRNDAGELGLSSSQFELDDVQQVGDGTWTSVQSNNQTTCAIDSDSKLWCWGANGSGQIGDGTRNSATSPRLLMGTWRAVSPGYAHTCGIRDDGAMWCWGANDTGQLGIGAVSANEPSMTPIASAQQWLEVAAGVTHTCAIDSEHRLWCWGLNDNGQLANGGFSTTAQPTPQRVTDEQWQTIDVDSAFGCAITLAGRLRCWGYNGHGQLGDGTLNALPSPTAVLVDGRDRSDWRAVTVGGWHSCAITADEELYCWGSSTRGQVGRDGDFAVPLPNRIAPEKRWVRLAAGVYHTCAIANDATMWCIGADGTGQLGDGGTAASTPQRVMGEWQTASAGTVNTCAIDLGFRAWCSGDNEYGQLGLGAPDSHASPAQIGSASWTAVATGRYHACGIQDGNVWCWGGNYAGQLGTGGYDAHSSPVAIGSGVKLTASEHTCTLTSSNLMYCWGNNANGQIGNSSTATTEPSPVAYTGVFMKAVAAGEQHTCSLESSSGFVYCWGANQYGQLGTNDTVSSAQPRYLNTSAAQIATGGAHSCAIAANGDATCWGANFDGQLSIDGGGQRSVPTPITNQWSSLALGAYHTCGIRTDGTLWCWGSNARGQLGDSTRISRAAQRQVGTANDWRSITAGSFHTCAVNQTNAMYCWGENNEGQLANGKAWRTSVVQVP
jgi:alpha-tubulin suppressor-like RCC1 family protein